MKKLLCVVMSLLTLSFCVKAGTYSGGSGTEASPYQISTLEDLSELCQTAGDWDKYFILTNDINAAQTQFWDDSDDNSDGDLYNDPNDALAAGLNEGFPGIGITTDPFDGNFDGDNYKISNLTIDRPSTNYIGFFGYASYAVVSNLGMTSVDIHGDERVGGFAGSFSRSTVENCYSSGTVRSEYINLGGFVGSASSYSTTSPQLISNCYSSCNVFSDYTTTNETIGAFGGFVGNNGSRSEIVNCYATGNVNVKAARAGGFVGRSGQDAEILQCYSTGNVTGRNSVGGFAGYLDNDALIKNCYCHGSVHRGELLSLLDDIGGFCGNNSNSDILYCYSTGSVYYDGTDNPTNQGFMGNYFVHDGFINDNFFDATLSNQTTSGDDGATAKTTAQMYTLSTYTNSTLDELDIAWDFIGTVNNDEENEDYWDIDEGSGYPYLSWEKRDMTWLGTNSTWDNANNWEGSLGLPSSEKNVIIPNTANDPVLQNGDDADCNDLSIQAGGALTIESGGSLITNGSITNNGTFLMYHSGSSEYWHYVSSPVQGATASVFAGDFLQYYTENAAPGNHYTEIADGATPLNVCQGYAWRSAAKGSFTFSGTPYTGNQQYTGMTTSDDYGWNLLGNPYPSSLDWNMLDDTYGAVYTYVQNSDAEDDYVWRSYNDGGTNGGVRYIPPMQGFFIAADGKTSFTVTNNERTHGGADGFVKSENNLDNYVLLQVNNGSIYDEILIQIGNQYKEGFELVHDAWQMGVELNNRLLIYSKCEDGSLSIDRRPETSSIQMGFKNPKNSMINIYISESSGLENLILEDTKLNKFHDLTQSAYQFDWETTDSEERFILHLNATNTQEPDISETNIYTVGKQLYITIDKPENYSFVKVLNIRGQVVYEQELSEKDLNRFVLNAQKGVYLVQLIGESQSLTEKIIIK